MYQPKIFPSLVDQTWAIDNLDRQARVQFPEDSQNLAYTHPAICDVWIRNIAKYDHGAKFIAGGFLEDRAHLWRGSYIKAPKSIHLGFDIQANAGEPVSLPTPARVEHILFDSSEAGWGCRILFELKDAYLNANWLIYGHLAHCPLVKVGQRVQPGQAVGVLGNSSENGRWFPHLHVQLCMEEAIRPYDPDFIHRMETLDGYGTIEEALRLYRDPAGLVGGPR